MKQKKKRAVEATLKKTEKSDLFAELKEGMDALADARQGKRSLRTHSAELKLATTVTPKN